MRGGGEGEGQVAAHLAVREPAASRVSSVLLVRLQHALRGVGHQLWRASDGDMLLVLSLTVPVLLVCVAGSLLLLLLQDVPVQG